MEVWWFGRLLWWIWRGRL